MRVDPDPPRRRGRPAEPTLRNDGRAVVAPAMPFEVRGGWWLVAGSTPNLQAGAGERQGEAARRACWTFPGSTRTPSGLEPIGGLGGDRRLVSRRRT